jgi:membrane protein YdbS with pleckstrin-like domain
MVFNKNKNRLNLATWVKIFLILDIVIYISLLLMFPNLWFIGYNFVLLIIGTIVSYLIFEKLLKYKDNNWRKLAEILVTMNVGLNAIFCIIITAAIIIGVLNAAGA